MKCSSPRNRVPRVPEAHIRPIDLESPREQPGCPPALIVGDCTHPVYRQYIIGIEPAVPHDHLVLVLSLCQTRHTEPVLGAEVHESLPGGFSGGRAEPAALPAKNIGVLESQGEAPPAHSLPAIRAHPP